MNPNRIRPADPVCNGCKKQTQTVALIEGFGFLCPACTTLLKAWDEAHQRAEREEAMRP